MSNDTLEKLREDMEDLSELLKRERDELKVKLSLAKLEAREEWEETERKWEHFRAKAQQVGHEAGEASKEIGAAARLLGEEIKEAYKRIRRLM